MVTRAIKPKRDDAQAAVAWQTLPERAPSVMIETKPTFARFVFMVGALFTLIGILAQIAPGRFPYMVSPGWGLVCLSWGLALVLFHALTDTDEQFRRVYGFAGIVLLFGAMAVRFLPIGGSVGTYFMPIGLPMAGYGLLLIWAVLRHETQEFWRDLLSKLLLLFAGVMIFGGIVGINLYRGEHVNEGLLLMILGLIFATVSIGFLKGDAAHGASLSLGAIGAFCVVEAVIRSWLSGSEGVHFLIPSGFILIVLGVVYFMVSVGAVSDAPFVVLTRRELAAFIYSPVGYPVFIGLMLIGWYNFMQFVDTVIFASGRQGGIPEPVVFYYIIDLVPVIAQMFLVPVITMRLLSEEQRTGTLEVLLTSPVNETAVVLSKFVAALAYYMLMWLPWWVFLISFRIGGESEYDYRSLLTFGVALLATGSGFVAMGIFFSSVTRNQIVAAVLTFVGMVAHLATFLAKRAFRLELNSPLSEVLTYTSFLDVWFQTLQGHLAPRFLVFHVSLAIFFLFLAIKVLESRKWK